MGGEEWGEKGRSGEVRTGERRGYFPFYSFCFFVNSEL